MESLLTSTFVESNPPAQVQTLNCATPWDVLLTWKTLHKCHLLLESYLKIICFTSRRNATCHFFIFSTPKRNVSKKDKSRTQTNRVLTSANIVQRGRSPHNWGDMGGDLVTYFIISIKQWMTPSLSPPPKKSGHRIMTTLPLWRAETTRLFLGWRKVWRGHLASLPLRLMAGRSDGFRHNNHHCIWCSSLSCHRDVSTLFTEYTVKWIWLHILWVLSAANYSQRRPINKSRRKGSSHYSDMCICFSRANGEQGLSVCEGEDGGEEGKKRRPVDRGKERKEREGWAGMKWNMRQLGHTLMQSCTLILHAHFAPWFFSCEKKTQAGQKSKTIVCYIEEKWKSYGIEILKQQKKIFAIWHKIKSHAFWSHRWVFQNSMLILASW